MKNSLILLFCCAGTLLSAATFEELMESAKKSENLSERFELADKALAEAKQNDQKLQAARYAFEMANRANNNEKICKYGEILSKLPGITPEERMEATFQFLYRLAPVNGQSLYIGLRVASTKDWQEFLKLPGIPPQKEYQALLRMARDAMYKGPYDVAEEAFLKAYNHPQAPLAAKPGIMLEYIEAMRRQSKRAEALAEIEKQLQTKMPATIRIRMLLTKIRTLIYSPDYYFEPAKEDITLAYSTYEAIRKIPIRTKPETEVYSEAMLNYVKFCFDQKDYARTERVAINILEDKKHPLRGSAIWSRLSTYQGRSLNHLRRFPEAVAIFEKLTNMKYELDDTLMYLGKAYYGTGEYTLAIGCFSEALKQLEGAEDDRPGWCKAWVKKLTWFVNGAKVLDKAIRDHEALEQELAANGGVIKPQEQTAAATAKRPAAASSSAAAKKKKAPAAPAVKNSMIKNKKKKTEVKDLKDIRSDVGDITEDGLQLE